jgi:DNA-binding transcriptional LysR family regulator
MTKSPLQNRLFRQLIAIQDSGSIRKAAEQLNLSQPALSKNIQDFERRLGMPLLHRGRTGAILTEPAKDITKRGRQILLLTEEIERDLRQWPQTRTGSVRLGAGSGSLVPLMRHVIQDFLLQYPDVNVEVYSRNPRELAKMIESGELDILVAIDETLEDTDILVRRPLRREEAHLFARRGHRLTKKKSCTQAEVAQYRFASPFMTDNLVEWFRRAGRDGGKQSNYLICPDYHVLCEAIMRCDCVGVCTEPMFGYLAEQYDIERLNVEGFKMQVMVNCIYRKLQEFSRSTRALIEMIEKQMKTLG